MAADPNSQNQLWAKWTFIVHDAGRRVSKAEVELNAARWLRKGFGSAGRCRVQRTFAGWRIESVVETGHGKPSYDPVYVQSVKSAFTKFVKMGWGNLAWGDVSVKVLAGDVQDGKPRSQMIEMPSLDIQGMLGRMMHGLID